MLYARSPYASFVTRAPKVEIPPENIQATFIFILQYWGLETDDYLNFSNSNYIRFSLNNTNIYLTQDDLADVVICGPGLLRGLDFEDVLLILVHNGSAPVELLQRRECYKDSLESLAY